MQHHISPELLHEAWLYVCFLAEFAMVVCNRLTYLERDRDG